MENMDHRKSKRFKEKRKDESRQITVTFVQQFSPARTFVGKMYDLSENAVKVIIDKKNASILLDYIPKTTLTKFRFSDKYKVTVCITSIKRIDDITNENDKIGVVLNFEVMSPEDADTVREIVNVYSI